MQLPPLGLYIHLPWCQRKCPYCDFNSHERDNMPERKYADTLTQDLAAELGLIQEREIKTIFIGGGTPSLFSANTIARLLEYISNLSTLAADVEVTMESNPGSAEADKFCRLYEAGVNRLSLGIQTFDNTLLKTLGRIHTSEEALAAIESAHAAGFDNLNLDLMHGLPGQTARHARSDLMQAITAAPQHLSWYQLTIEPNTVFHNRPPALPKENALADIQDCGEDVLKRYGYKQYEISAYSRSGFDCRHNLNYWTFGDYLGIGAGAHGKITFPDGRIARYSKRRQPDAYMSNYTMVGKRTLSADDTVAEFMMNALRLDRGFTLADFTSRTGLASCILDKHLDSLQTRELLTVNTGVVSTTALGRRFLNTVLAEFS
ncbi:MAG: radical SAM family heme chaperone HemW [Halioglobus sp.]|nr:radical SAM family heme chaperone HemW [Halioglobus sp.]